LVRSLCESFPLFLNSRDRLTMNPYLPLDVARCSRWNNRMSLIQFVVDTKAHVVILLGRYIDFRHFLVLSKIQSSRFTRYLLFAQYSNLHPSLRSTSGYCRTERCFIRSIMPFHNWNCDVCIRANDGMVVGREISCWYGRRRIDECQFDRS